MILKYLTYQLRYKRYVMNLDLEKSCMWWNDFMDCVTMEKFGEVCDYQGETRFQSVEGQNIFLCPAKLAVFAGNIHTSQCSSLTFFEHEMAPNSSRSIQIVPLPFF